MALRVALNGYGTIGKRVADAVAKQPDLRLVGVTKTRPSFEAREALEKGYRLFVAGNGGATEFEDAGLSVSGTLDNLLDEADVVVDCSPEKIGRANADIYKARKLHAIFQGGEKPEVAEASFNALANFDNARGKRTLRVVSCNTSGIVRAASVLASQYGIEHWEATLVRRAADPPEAKKGPVNGIMPSFQFPSHHGPDAQTVLPGLPIVTMAVVVPTTLMHVHANYLRLRRPPSSTADVVQAFRSTPRFRVFHDWEKVDGTPQVMEYARDRGAGRGDMMENVLWENGIRLDGNSLYFFQAIHQESIVVPENIDAIRAMFELTSDRDQSIATTDRALGIPSTYPRVAPLLESSGVGRPTGTRS
jgi:glyceraldehyde-3-phosphate dehydrogenase (NAD(P))